MRLLYCFMLHDRPDGSTAISRDVLRDLSARGLAIDGIALATGDPNPDIVREFSGYLDRFDIVRHPGTVTARQRIAYRVANKLTPRRRGGRHFCPPSFYRHLTRHFPLAEYDGAITMTAQFAHLATLLEVPVVADIHELFSHKAAMLAQYGFDLASPYVNLDEELEQLQAYDVIWCPSWTYRDLLASRLEDTAIIDRHLSIESIVPTGFATPREQLAERTPDAPPNLLFVGSTALENRPGLFHFLRHIFPALREREPSLVFDLIGWEADDLPGELAQPGVRSHGRLPQRADVMRYYARADLVVIPRFLDGLTIKGVEALALGKAVVAHPLGFSGCYAVENGTHAMVADSDAAFVRSVLELLGDPDLRVRLGDNAWRLARTLFTSDNCYVPLLRALSGRGHEEWHSPRSPSIAVAPIDRNLA